MLIDLYGNFINNAKLDAFICGSIVLPCRKGVYPVLEGAAMHLPVTIEISSLEAGAGSVVPYLSLPEYQRMVLFQSPHKRAKLRDVSNALILQTADYGTTVLAMVYPGMRMTFSYRGRSNTLEFIGRRLTCAVHSSL